MYAPFSADEREALSRFVGKLAEDAEKMARLLEARGLDNRHLIEAHSCLSRSLELLQNGEPMPPAQRTLYRAAPDLGYNHLS